jgi:glycine cleavage system H protein
MSDELVFEMGKHQARFPTDRFYLRTHMWFLKNNGAYRVGFTAYVVPLLQDVYFLDWSVEPGTVVEAKQEIGELESSKAVSTIPAPTDGTLLSFNQDLMKDPTAINVDCYGKGWLFEFEPTNAEFLSAADYIKHLEGTWDETQRMIKGQMHG